MSEPVRIYLDGDAEAGDGYFTRCFETAKPCSEPAIEYIRADLCAPTQDEQVKRLVEAVQAFADFDALPTHSKRPDVFEIRVRQPLLRAHAALRALEQGEE